MDKYTKLQRYSEKLCKEHHIMLKSSEKEKIIQQIALYIDALIFNVVSIICLITVINNNSKITNKTLEVGKKYIDTKCNFNYTKLTSKMSGGRLGSATFLGANESMYSASNPTNDILPIDLNGEFARPQIGGAKMSKVIYSYMNSILAYHNISASKDVKNEICKIIEHHIKCLVSNLKSSGKSLSLNSINKIVKNNVILHHAN